MISVSDPPLIPQQPDSQNMLIYRGMLDEWLRALRAEIETEYTALEARVTALEP